MNRGQIANILEECGTLLELKGENPFRCNAYRNAARAVLQLEGDLDSLVGSGEIKSVKGIGETMADKIGELLSTGKLEFHDQLRGEIPAGLLDMLRINSFGPKKASQVHQLLGVDSIEKLKIACEDGRVAALKGFGKKTAEKILSGIEFLDKTGKRVYQHIARELAERMKESLAKLKQVQRLEVCGSLRRGAETIKDIDLLVASDDPEPIMKAFVEHPDVVQITGHGPTKSSVVLSNGVPADLRVVSRKQFPFALHYFTGSKQHNVAIRARAQERGLKLNEYELAGEKRSVECAEEADIFKALDLDYIPPELREDNGEILAAEQHSLPALLTESDLNGVFHCHTTYSDGRDTLEAMVEGAKAKGYKFLGIADHSKTAAYAGGLQVERVLEQQKRIDELNKKQKGFRIFKGIESDILPDGSLDYDDETLDTFDYIVASVHASFNLDEAAMTERVLKAMRHPGCRMLGHPTGRLLLQRDGFSIDMEKILREAARLGVFIELNANPHRLDIDWVACKRAKALGVTVVINPDAHAVAGYNDMQYGVATARRGWLEPKNVFNTFPVAEIAKILASPRKGSAAAK